MKKAIIIGAGPAGLTAAYELLKRTDILPVVLESTDEIGGISKTRNFKGYRMDMGGHRFFSKSDRVMEWWLNILPLQGHPAKDDLILGTRKPFSKAPDAPDPEKTDRVMLIRKRLSRVLYRRKLFDYPIAFNRNTIRNLGFLDMARIGFSYFFTRIRPPKPVQSLEDFIISRFGKKLYAMFFRDYTQKVWGIPPSQIKPDWGAQRIKGLSVSKIILHALSKALRLPSRRHGVSQKGVETSLIHQFYYPKHGPGQLWEEVADTIRSLGGEIRLNTKAVAFEIANHRAAAVIASDRTTGSTFKTAGDFVFSSMPVQELIAGMEAAPPDIRRVARGLVYRNFITVGLLLDEMAIKNTTGQKTVNQMIPDLWIYVQENDVRLGRLQLFNNWSPYLLADPNKAWLGLEYFASDGDSLWNLPEGEMAALAVKDLVRLGFAEENRVLDHHVVKVPKAYPAYFGTYDEFDKVRRYVDTIENLFLIGRNGMHKYNNMDHSMLTAMTAVDNIINQNPAKDNIWSVNTEDEFHEEDTRQ